MVTVPQSIPTMAAAPKPEPAKIKERYSLSLADAAAFFRELAQEMESNGVIEMGTPTQSISVAVQEPVPMEIGYKEEKGRKKLKIKVEIEEKQVVFADPSGRPKIGLRE
ncbi:MAG TPA: amphi-Trp domain-containing protein [Methanotrichaceae archaeon]|nr:amphi-Trp domain-containing protein [Methanotrichaceae archaeon]